MTSLDTSAFEYFINFGWPAARKPSANPSGAPKIPNLPGTRVNTARAEAHRLRSPLIAEFDGEAGWLAGRLASWLWRQTAARHGNSSSSGYYTREDDISSYC